MAEDATESRRQLGELLRALRTRNSLVQIGALFGDDESLMRAKADCVYQLLRSIVEGIPSVQITTKLPGERALQQEFDLAPVTIRKAIRLLRDEGLVRTVPGMGTWVVRED